MVLLSLRPPRESGSTRRDPPSSTATFTFTFTPPAPAMSKNLSYEELTDKCVSSVLLAPASERASERAGRAEGVVRVRSARTHASERAALPPSRRSLEREPVLVVVVVVSRERERERFEKRNIRDTPS